MKKADFRNRNTYELFYRICWNIVECELRGSFETTTVSATTSITSPLRIREKSSLNSLSSFAIQSTHVYSYSIRCCSSQISRRLPKKFEGGPRVWRFSTSPFEIDTSCCGNGRERTRRFENEAVGSRVKDVEGTENPTLRTGIWHLDRYQRIVGSFVRDSFFYEFRRTEWIDSCLTKSRSATKISTMSILHQQRVDEFKIEIVSI